MFLEFSGPGPFLIEYNFLSKNKSTDTHLLFVMTQKKPMAKVGICILNMKTDVTDKENDIFDKSTMKLNKTT